jgi:hypothetical protein
MRFFAVFGIAILCLLAGCGQSQSTAVPKPSRDELEAILAATETVQSDFSYLGKIDDNLKKLITASLSGENVTQTAQALGLTVTDDKEVLLDIYVTNPVDEASMQLASLGMTVQSTNASFGVVEGLLPIGQVLKVARLENTKALLSVAAFGTDKIP